MRILHCITTLGRGGAESQLLMLARYQRLCLGHDVTVACLKGPNELGTAFENEGVNVLVLGRDSVSTKALFHLFRIIRAEKFDVVHTHLLRENFLAGITARICSARLVVAHKHNDDIQMKNWLFAIVHDLLSRFTDDVVIYLSDYVKWFFENQGILPAKVGYVVHYGFDRTIYPEPCLDQRARLGIEKTSPIIATLSRIDPQKGIEILIQAFERLREDIFNAHLIVAGRATQDKRYEKKIHDMVSRSPARDAIHFIGHHQNPAEIYQAADCFVLASRWEGFGLVLLEAMMFGVPIVATSVSAIPEVVRDGIDGILVPAGNVDSLCSAMKKTLRDNQVGGKYDRSMRTANLDALSRFEPERQFLAIDRIYRNERPWPDIKDQHG